MYLGFGENVEFRKSEISNGTIGISDIRRIDLVCDFQPNSIYFVGKKLAKIADDHRRIKVGQQVLIYSK